MVANFTPVARPGLIAGIPFGGEWELVVDSADRRWGGAHAGAPERVQAQAEESHGRPFRLQLDVPALGALVLRGRRESAEG